MLGLNAGHCPSETSGPEVTRLEIFPAVVSATAGAEFRMLVRVFGPGSSVLGDPVVRQVIWESDGADVQLPTAPDGAEIAVRISTGTPPVPQIRKLTARLGTRSATAEIRMAPSLADAPGDADWVLGRGYSTTPVSRPRLALVNGFAGSEVPNHVIGFAGHAWLPAFECPPETGGGTNTACGSVSVFSASQAAAHYANVKWSSQCDVLRLSSDAGGVPSGCAEAGVMTAGPATMVDVVAWIAAGGVTEGAVQLELDYARRVFSDARVGVNIVANTRDLLASHGSRSVVVEGATKLNNWRCEDAVFAQLADAGVPLSELKQARTTVVYFDEVYLKEDGATATTTMGFTCAWDEARGSLILMARERAPTTLAHEFGHAFAAWDPQESGHVKTDAGLYDDSNLMVLGRSTTESAWRTSLTLGQVFRMTLARGSVHHRVTTANPSPGLDCQGTPSPCPPVSMSAR